MKSAIYLSVLFLIVLSGCDKDNSTSAPRSTSFVATIDGEVVEFQDARVLIKRENGFPVSQEIGADVIADDFVEKVLYFRYAGELSTANTDSTFTIIMGVYYENDYSDSWSNTTGPGGIDLTLTGYPSNDVSGSFSDFWASDGSDTLFISDISFENIPIRYLDF